jgi:hypothetical protein
MLFAVGARASATSRLVERCENRADARVMTLAPA